VFVDLSKIVRSSLLERLNEERKLDNKKGIHKIIKTNIETIDLLTQTESRISVSVNLKYTEQIFNNNGELINETTFNPFLKVKYILEVYINSWKLVDYISCV